MFWVVRHLGYGGKRGRGSVFVLAIKIESDRCLKAREVFFSFLDWSVKLP